MCLSARVDKLSGSRIVGAHLLVKVHSVTLNISFWKLRTSWNTVQRVRLTDSSSSRMKRTPHPSAGCTRPTVCQHHLLGEKASGASMILPRRPRPRHAPVAETALVSFCTTPIQAISTWSFESLYPLAIPTPIPFCLPRSHDRVSCD